jgi:acyl-CoA reductase-like NAD-dependent aldehyde dehydrogenase
MSKHCILPFVNPATGEVFGEVAAVTPEQAQAEVGLLSRLQPEWENLGLKRRADLLRRFLQLLIDEVDQLSEVISLSTGKSRQDALIEVFLVADQLSYQLKNAPAWLRPQRVSSGYFFFKRSYFEYRPRGVVAVLAPWNYPLALALPPVLSALLTGNAVVLKPSEVTPAVGVAIERLFARIPELARFTRVLHGGIEVGQAVINGRPDYVFLTGSNTTGRNVMKAAAELLIPVTCELGGKDPMIVLEDADLDAAARWGIWGAFYNAGQTCMGIERVYVVDAVYDQFISKAVHYLNQVQPGYTSEVESPYPMGPITDPGQVETIERQLEDAFSKGARLLAGGGRQALFMQPALLVDVDHRMEVMTEETFGPLFPVVRVKDEAEAIRLANDSDYGLSASVWSGNIPHARGVARRLRAGSVVINDTLAHFSVSTLPFGGVKGSGFGRIHGREGLLLFTEANSYLEGQPPSPFDFVTLMRKPGNYLAGRAMLRLLLGTTLRKRLEALPDLTGFLKRIFRRES